MDHKEVNIMRNLLMTPDRRLSVWDLINEVDKTFNQAFEQKSEDVNTSFFAPQVDIEETQDLYMISVDLPGVKKDQVQIDVLDGVLKLSGRRDFERKSEDKHFYRLERRHGSFERSFRLPEKIDESKIQASFEDGVLEIMVPKSELSKARKVEIATGKGSLFSKLIGSKEAKTEKSINTPKNSH